MHIGIEKAAVYNETLSLTSKIHLRQQIRIHKAFHEYKNHEKILGCTTVNRVYVTPIGDVLVCPYVHIKIGNIFEQSLKEIIDHGFKIKYFRNHSDLCLAGEDKSFIRKFMTKQGQTIFKPALASEIFSKDDFVKNADKE